MRLALALVPLALVAALPAKATTTIENWTFQASTPTGPITSHSGSFSFSYDQDGPYNPQLLSINFTLGSIVYDLTNTDLIEFTGASEPNQFIIGGAANGGARRLGPGSLDWWFYTIPTEDTFSYTTNTTTFVYTDRAVRFTRETLTAPVNNPVPEPATWAMLIAGFGLVGAAQRKRRARQPATS